MPNRLVDEITAFASLSERAKATALAIASMPELEGADVFEDENSVAFEFPPSERGWMDIVVASTGAVEGGRSDTLEVDGLVVRRAMASTADVRTFVLEWLSGQ